MRRGLIIIVLLICGGCLNDNDEDALDYYPNGEMVCKVEVSGALYKNFFFYRSTATDDNSFGGIVLCFTNEDDEIKMNIKMKYKGNGIYELYNDTKSGFEYYSKAYTPTTDAGWLTIKDFKKSEGMVSGSFTGLLYSSGSTPTGINISGKFSAPYPDAKL